MSEGAQSMGDEPPVVGEPASQPHQAAVVGEPPEEVVGEPVPLANGLQKDQQPNSSPSPDESTVNGVHKESSEPPSQSSDAPTGSTEESPNPAMADAAEEHISSVEASAEEGTHRSATENPTSPEFNMDASDARAHEISDSTHGTNEANPDADVEVTHLVDVPSEPPFSESEFSTENPFSVLDEGSAEVVNEGEEPADVPSENAAEAVAATPPVEDEDFSKGLGAEGDATASHVAHEETPKGSGALTADSQGEASEEVSTEVEEKNVNKEMSEDIKAFEPNEADAATKGSSVGGSSQEEAAAEATGSVDGSVSTGEEKAQVGETSDENSAESGSTLSKGAHAKSEEEVKPVPAKQVEDVDASAGAPPSEAGRVVRRKADILPDVSLNDKVSSKEGEEQASSLVQIDKDVSAEAFPKETSGLRAIAMEAGNGDQAASDDPSFEENGFQHGQEGIPVEKEQGLAKGDSVSAEAKEKPSSRFKLPMLFTTLAVAVVGVAVASFSKSRH